MAKENLNTEVKTGKVRFLFPHLDEPSSYAGDPNSAKYSVMILIDKNDKQTLADIKIAYENAVQNAEARIRNFNPTKLVKKAKGDRDGILIDCDADPELSESSVNAGHYQLSLKSAKRPIVMSVNCGKRVLNKDEIIDEIYSGCYGRVKFNFYAYSKVGMGITTGLLTVAKTEEGEPIGGARGSVDDFDDEFDGDALAGF